MKMDVLTVGDALVDIFLSINPHDEHYHTDKGHDICFALGAKIPIEDSKFLCGGNACNVAVGLSRLGIVSGIVAEIGDDEFSQTLIAELKKEGVTIDQLIQTPGAQTSFSIDLTCMNDRTIFSRHIIRQHNFRFPPIPPQWIYLTSIGQEWKKTYVDTLAYVTQHNLQLAFNPGSTQLKEGIKSFQEILPHTTILFINKEEAEDFVYGHDQELSHEQKDPYLLLKKVKEMGPEIISMTDGEHGSYAIDQAGNTFFQKIIPVKFLQKTGVGDAYASGFLTAIIKKHSIQEAMQWGAINASSVISHIGAQGGLLIATQLEDHLKHV